MSIFKTGYNTTVGSAFITKAIQQELLKNIINNGTLNNLDVLNQHPIKLFFICGDRYKDNDVMLFNHPLLVKVDNKDILVTDLRLYINNHDMNAEFNKRIKNLTEFTFCKNRAILNQFWVNGEIDNVKHASFFASMVFTNLLAETISKIYYLDYKDQIKLSIATSVFYQTLFLDVKELNELDKQRIATHTIKATSAPSELVFECIDKLPLMSNLDSYCDAVKELLENIRLKDFNLAMLLTIIRNSWYGTNAKELIAIALEHPPTWIAMVYAAITEKTYTNSSVSKIAERLSKRGQSEEFIKNIKSLVDSEVDIKH